MKKLDSKKLNNKKTISHNKRTLIISDLDGTLLKNHENISENTIKIIKKITQQGHLFCIATGRSPKGSLDIYNKLDLNTVLVNFNGAFIWHPKKPEFMPINIVFHKNLVARLLKQSKIINHVDNIVVENFNGTYILKKPMDKYEIKDFNKWFHIDIHSASNYFFGYDYLKNMDIDPNTILLQIRKHNYIDNIMYYLKQSFNTFIVRSWSLPNAGNVIEINTKYANKGNAAEFLESYYGIQKDRTIAFGDGENDVELLQKVRFGYAMKNGSNTSKLVARYITSKPNVQDGVAVELQRIFLNKK